MATLYGTATDPMQAAITYYTLKNISGGAAAVSVIGNTTSPVATPVAPPCCCPMIGFHRDGDHLILSDGERVSPDVTYKDVRRSQCRAKVPVDKETRDESTRNRCHIRLGAIICEASNGC